VAVAGRVLAILAHRDGRELGLAVGAGLVAVIGLVGSIILVLASRAFAVQAGRDLRVLVDPEKASDEDATLLASRICARIEQELQFPGQIRVTVIRERRCVEYAR